MTDNNIRPTTIRRGNCVTSDPLLSSNCLVKLIDDEKFKINNSEPIFEASFGSRNRLSLSYHNCVISDDYEDVFAWELAYVEFHKYKEGSSTDNHRLSDGYYKFVNCEYFSLAEKELAIQTFCSRAVNNDPKLSTGKGIPFDKILVKKSNNA